MAMIAPAGLPPLQAVDNRLLDPATKMFAHEWMLMLPRSEKARLPQVVAGLETAGLKVHSFTLRSKTYVLISASVKKLVEVATTENYPMQLAAESDDTLLGSLQGDELDTYKEFIAMESSGMHTWFTSADLQEIRLCPFSSKLIKFFDYDEELMDSELLDGAQAEDKQFFKDSGERVDLVHRLIKRARVDHTPLQQYLDALPKTDEEGAANVQLVPLHCARELDELVEDWAEWQANPCRWIGQPLARVEGYYGSQVAMYFAWLGWYTKMLIIPSIVCTFLGVKQYSSPLGVDGNKWAIVNSIFLCTWAVVWLRTWQRREHELSFYWQTQNFEELQALRPEFSGKRKWDPEKGAVELQYSSYTSRMTRLVLSFAVFSVLILMVCFACGLSFYCKLYYKNGVGKWASPMANLMLISVFRVIHVPFAQFLTRFENHRTQTEYDDALIGKTFMFTFINNYCTLFFIAYIKQTPSYFGEASSCQTYKGKFTTRCMDELQFQLVLLFTAKMILGQLYEVFIAKYMAKRAADKREEKAADEARLAAMAAGKVATATTVLSDAVTDNAQQAICEQALKPSYTTKAGSSGTFDDYNEMATYFGYFMLFAPAFPLAPLLMLLNNLTEIRGDAFKICRGCQRTERGQAQDIGAWQWVFEVIAILSVVTNATIIGFTSSQLDERSEYWYESSNSTTSIDGVDLRDLGSNEEPPQIFRYKQGSLWAIVVLAEHLLLMFRFGLHAAIPVMPSWVAAAEYALKNRSAKMYGHKSATDARHEMFHLAEGATSLVKPPTKKKRKIKRAGNVHAARTGSGRIVGAARP